MITIIVNYIVYTSGHRRHHAGSQTLIIPPAVGHGSAGDSYAVTAFPSLIYNGSELQFAFMSVTGDLHGSEIFTTSGSQSIPIGETNVNVLMVYAPKGGGTGSPEIWVDAFNVDTGNFSDSDFMSVYTNGVLDSSKSKTANDDGIVSSDTAEDMRSYTSVDNTPFMEWFKIGVPSVITTIDYNLGVNEMGIAFAFYKAPKKPVDIGHNVRTVPTYVKPGVAVEKNVLTGFKE
jgi:hypothetical protein